MGAVSSGLSDGILRANCCVQRRPPVRCFNPHLNLQLLKLEHSGARIEEVWLVKQENERSQMSQGFSPMVAEPAETRLAIVYNISESASQPSLKPLRLDWQPDGLAFMQGGLSKSCVSVKVPAEPLSLEVLIQHLHTLEKREYDPQSFTSKDFCEYLFNLIEGKEERSKAQS
ncbi:unnamed protein product [Cladocopium goreaui]|uniref:Uncharacterized protein n=1 Tax=Cladocopium goreaui TaxID=2562237 RepID=A0A9P1DDG9_9DINO|nr:unnamed protein product [Cladocopium goreaui]